jgi:hypothetical protein
MNLGTFAIDYMGPISKPGERYHEARILEKQYPMLLNALYTPCPRFRAFELFWGNP